MMRGAEHTCAVRSNGEIECWGNTPHGLDDPDSADIGDHGVAGETTRHQGQQQGRHLKAPLAKTKHRR